MHVVYNNVQTPKTSKRIGERRFPNYRNLVAILENILENIAVFEGVGCTLSSDNNWLFFAEISSQDGITCNH